MKLLAIINKHTNLHEVCEWMIGQSPESSLVLSSHHLFSWEKRLFSQIEGLEFKEFRDFISETAADSIDQKVVQRARAEGYSKDIVRVFSEIREQNNRTIQDSLLANFEPKIIGADNHLGIDFRVWRACGARFAPWKTKVEEDGVGKKVIVALRSRRWPRVSMVLPKIEGRKTAFIVGKTERLGLSESEGRTIPLGPLLRFFSVHRALRIRWRTLFKMREVYVAFHDSLGDILYKVASTTKKPAKIVADGYFPRNYPHTYSDFLEGSEVFVPNIASAQWFIDAGLTVYPGPSFVKSPQAKFPSLSDFSKTPNVLFVLNHAGDWTSLISQSDTDYEVEMATSLARSNQDFRVILRPHPTAILWEHEGPTSNSRLGEHVSIERLENLLMSSSTLAEDLARADVVMGQYSEVLIKSFLSGKIVFAVNPTSRRSFFEFFSALGVPVLGSEEEMLNSLKLLVEAPEFFFEKQCEAARSFNRIQDEWNPFSGAGG